MRTARNTPTHPHLHLHSLHVLQSPELLELQRVFDKLEKPYGLPDILLFNRTYQSVYGLLGKEEKQRAEELVDALIEGLESRKLKSRIFGVV